MNLTGTYDMFHLNEDDSGERYVSEEEEEDEEEEKPRFHNSWKKLYT